MARSDRLLRLLHALRCLPQPVTAARLAEETGVSARTLYRDVAALRAAGAMIDGEAGYGYRLTEDPALPPQMFDRLELEAVVLGLAEVRQIGDPKLAAAAERALVKITAALPERMQRQAVHAVLQVYRYDQLPSPSIDMDVLREAGWEERAVFIVYRDAEGRESERTVWPLSVVYLERKQVLLAWCCRRADFRKFLIDRIVSLAPTNESFRPRRVPLLREYIDRMVQR